MARDKPGTENNIKEDQKDQNGNRKHTNRDGEEAVTTRTQGAS